MKKLLIAAVVLCFAAPGAYAADAAGSAFGNLQTAETIGQGNGHFMGAVGIGDNGTSVVGSFRYGLAEYLDGALKGGIYDTDYGETEITIGADIKYQLWSVDTTGAHPFDLALGGMFEYLPADFVDIFQLGGFALASYPLQFDNGMGFVPYGKLNIRMENYSTDDRTFPDGIGGTITVEGESDTEIKFGIHLGGKLELTETVDLFGEFQLDGNEALFVGIDFSVL